MVKLRDLFGINRDNTVQPDDELNQSLEGGLLQESHQAHMAQDISILEDEYGGNEQRVQREATKEVQNAARTSLRRLHVIQMGRCPVCGEHLRQHLFASICESCGWHTFDTPTQGRVVVHLRQGQGTVEGDSCYAIKSGALLVIKDDLVVAKVAGDGYEYVDYVWSPDEVRDRHRRVVARMSLTCGWCDNEVDPDKDGFHLVHVAFGATQERYCFCSDDCYEAFRRMYPARVHRDCYNRNCAECNMCIKRYPDEGEGIQTLAKDFLSVKHK